MSFKDILYYSLLRVKRNKKNIFLFIILLIGCLTITGALTYKNFISQNVNDLINKYLGYRTVIAIASFEYEDKSDEEFYNELKKLDHVLEVYNADYNSINVPLLNDEDNSVSLTNGSTYSLPKKIIGKTIKEDDTGVAICPIKFKKNMEDYYNTDDFIDGQELIKTGISINVPIYDKVNGKLILTDKFYQKKYNVIGLYDPVTNGNLYNTCYISPKDMKELFDIAESANKSSLPIAHVIVDDLKNVDSVRETIADKGFESFNKTTINYDYVKEVNQICNIIIIISCIGIFVLTILYIKKINNDNLQNIGIQKAYGYSNGNIQNFSMCELLIISFISIFISFILAESCYLIINIFFKDYINLKERIITHSMLNYWFGFLIILVVPIITNSLLNLFYNKKNAINLIRKK